MNENEFRRRSEAVAQAADPHGLRSTDGLDDDGIAAAESDVRAEFPAAYRWFLRHYWTGLFGDVDLYTLRRGDAGYLGSRQPAGTLGRFVAFADDGCGNAYCFPVVDGVCEDRVVVVPLLASEYTGETMSGGFLDFLTEHA